MHHERVGLACHLSHAHMRTLLQSPLTPTHKYAILLLDLSDDTYWSELFDIVWGIKQYF